MLSLSFLNSLGHCAACNVLAACEAVRSEESLSDAQFELALALLHRLRSDLVGDLAPRQRRILHQLAQLTCLFWHPARAQSVIIAGLKDFLIGCSAWVDPFRSNCALSKQRRSDSFGLWQIQGAWNRRVRARFSLLAPRDLVLLAQRFCVGGEIDFGIPIAFLLQSQVTIAALGSG